MRTLIAGSSLLLSILAFTTSARADQCQSVEGDIAIPAVKILRGATVLAYCEPCHDAMPTKAPSESPATVQVHVSPVKGLQTIAVNGKDVDLAYTYVKTGTYTWSNVGLMAGCGALDVTGFLTIGAPAKSYGPPPPLPQTPAALQAERDDVARLDAAERALEERVAKAMSAVANAQNDHDRKAAQDALHALFAEKTTLDQKVAAAKAQLAHDEREHGLHH